MGWHELLTLVRTASRSPLGLVGLIVIAATVLALFLGKRADKSSRTALLAVLLLGMASWAGAIVGVIPSPPAFDGVRMKDGSIVITIDRENDHHGGLPGKLFDGSRTNHMIRNPARGGLWSPAGSPPYNLGWVVRPLRPGRYDLRVLYASEVSRPTEIGLDDQPPFTGLAHTTGNALKPQWFAEGTVELHEGANHLWFHAMEPPPNIDALRLTSVVTR